MRKFEKTRESKPPKFNKKIFLHKYTNKTI